MIVPEIIIFNTVNQFLDLITADFNANLSTPNCSLLYKMFYKDDNGDVMITEDYSYLEQAQSIILRTDESPRKVSINIGYNVDKAAAPTIHILLPAQNNGKFETLGQGETDVYQDTNCSTTLFRDKKTTHNATYNLMITSENVNEVLILYYLLLDMFVVLNDHFGLSGLLDLKAMGQDVTVQSDLVPQNIYHRNLAINFDYETVSTFLANATVVGGIKFNLCNDIGDENLSNP